jgi:hypothetical protein
VIDKATLSFYLQPKNAVNWKYISLYPTEEWPRILGLSLLVNDQKVDDFKVSWDKERSLATAIATKQEVTKKQERVPQRKKTYVEVAPHQLANYLHSRVKIETKLNRKYEGQVLRSGGELIVQIKSHGGKVDIPADSSTIAKAYVYK